MSASKQTKWHGLLSFHSVFDCLRSTIFYYHFQFYLILLVLVVIIQLDFWQKLSQSCVSIWMYAYPVKINVWVSFISILQVWTVLDMAVDLRNVTIELLHQHRTPTQPPESLARLDFITSKLAFVSYSNQSKDIDLASQEIRVTDTRGNQNSAFKDILQVTDK